MSKRSKAKSAVAIKYDSAKDKSPKVVAKGSGNIAEKIIAVANENGVPIKEDSDLVQVLSQIDIDQEISPAVYQVVAELLAFIYEVNKDFPRPKSS
jgi:flagellar biosynthesis protein